MGHRWSGCFTPAEDDRRRADLGTDYPYDFVVANVIFGENMQVKIAVVQFAIHQFAPRKNLKKAEQFIIEAASQQAQIIVFPEDFVTGPLSGNNAFADYEGQYVKHFQKLALQYSIDIVPIKKRCFFKKWIRLFYKMLRSHTKLEKI